MRILRIIFWAKYIFLRPLKIKINKNLFGFIKAELAAKNVCKPIVFLDCLCCIRLNGSLRSNKKTKNKFRIKSMAKNKHI